MTEVFIRRRRPKGGRPRKPEVHRHVENVSGRLTPAEHVVFGRVLAARAARGLPGGKNASDWIRAALHEQALRFGVELPDGYTEVRLVRDVLPSMPVPPDLDEG